VRLGVERRVLVDLDDPDRLAAHGEGYNAERLMADLLAGLGTEAPPPLVDATSARLDAMGARASAAAVRTLGGGA
jgi:hypothetical protein